MPSVILNVDLKPMSKKSGQKDFVGWVTAQQGRKSQKPTPKGN